MNRSATVSVHSVTTRSLPGTGLYSRKFPDMLDAPVFLVDNDINILAANTLAIAITKKPVAEVRGTTCGKVLECINAYLPEGCGKTTFCPDCAIQASVNETYETGHPVTRRPTVVSRKIGGTPEEIYFFCVYTKRRGRCPAPARAGKKGLKTGR